MSLGQLMLNQCHTHTANAGCRHMYVPLLTCCLLTFMWDECTDNFGAELS